MVSVESLAIVVVLCTVLSVLSLRFGLMTKSGALASFFVGVVCGGMGSVGWLLTLIVFSFMGFAVTKFRFQIKESKGLQEGKKGERTYRNVLANGLVPALVAIVAFATGTQDSVLAVTAYVSSVAVAAADTTASELGVLSDRTYLITTGEKVAPGTNGGVSLNGTLWCIIASVIASYTGWLVILKQPFDPLFLLPSLMGVVGCMVDSLIGATLERRGVVGKLHVNFLSMAFGSIAAVALYLVI